MLILQNLSYTHPNKDVLFSTINLKVNKNEKIALIGNNGVGKSTLLKIIANELTPTSGQKNIDTRPYYIPQIYGQYNHLTIGEVLKVDSKINALNEILKGNITEENYTLLNDDWTIEERINEALLYWKLDNLKLSQKMETLSGGQKTKIFLAGISIHQPEFVLLDEPSNHLDNNSRQLLYNFIQSTKSTLIIVSHDRKLLNLLNSICELSKDNIKVYGGNYDFYKNQKQIENNALTQDIHHKEKALKRAKDKERDTVERQQKLDSRGKGKQEKAGVAKIMMNTLRNNAENSTSKLKNVHAEKIGGITHDLQNLRSSLSTIDKMKFGFDNSQLHKGKTLFKAINVNFTYSEQNTWNENLNFEIISGDRIAIKGKNGSGKTTLIKLILNLIQPKIGTIYKNYTNPIYIDQDYSLLDNRLNVYEQAQKFNIAGLEEHDIKIRLNRFLFTKDDWNKSCYTLSGGERMRLLLCCLIIKSKSPDIIILDEPTNNLDIQNVEILTAAINEYKGTLIVISHDDTFIEQINIEKSTILHSLKNK